MSKLFIGVSIMLVAFFNAAQVYAQQFAFSGKLSGQPDAPIILSYLNNDGISIKDSTTLQNGEFIFKGKISGGVLADLSVSKRSSKYKIGNERNTIEIFLEPGNISATGNYDNLSKVIFSGSKSQAEYKTLEEQLIPYYRSTDYLETKWLSLNAELINIMKKNEDDIRIKPMEKTMDSLNEKMMEGKYKIIRPFITSHYGSYVSAYELNDNKTYWGFDEVKTTYDKLHNTVKEGVYGKKLSMFIAGIEENLVGRKAKAFTRSDINGKTVSLDNFKGRYILLDFWGSWCAPCRASTPHIKNLFEKYHKAGLDVIAIAVDDKTEMWKKAVKKDGTEMWYNIKAEPEADINTGIKGIDKDFNIHVFPSKILVGKDGTIIGRYDGSETDDLDKKLAAIFN